MRTWFQGLSDAQLTPQELAYRTSQQVIYAKRRGGSPLRHRPDEELNEKQLAHRASRQARNAERRGSPIRGRPDEELNEKQLAYRRYLKAWYDRRHPV